MGNINIDLETLEEQSKTATPKASTAHTDKHTQTNTRLEISSECCPELRDDTDWNFQLSGVPASIWCRMALGWKLAREDRF